MHTLRLCDTVLRAHLHPATPKPSKLPNCSSPFTRFHKKSMNSCWRSHFRLSRHAGQWLEYLDIDKESSRHFPQSSDLQHVLRLTEDTVDHWEKAVNLMQIQQDIDPLDKSVVVTSLKEEKCTSTSFENDAIHVSCTHAPLFSTVKFALLFGLLTFHGSQQAVASSEFSPIDFIGDLGDISTGFASAFLLIFFSELGDKTFFIAALLASRNSGSVIFIGTFGALAAMTIISVVLGRTFHYIDDILPFRFGDTDLPIDDIAAVFLLVYFGVSTLLEAASSDSLKTAEEQKQAELAVTELSGNSAGSLAAANTVISTFILVFVAEWGDKSFFSTIALAAASSPLGVIVGALAGHATATLLAVLGGSLLGTFFSEKVISYVGGALFLVFAMVTLIEIVS